MKNSLFFIGGVLLLAFSGFMGFLLGQKSVEIDIVNPEDFLQVQDITIDDAFYGEDHAVEAVRAIVAQFWGRWTVEINTAENQFACLATGVNVYSPGNELPEDLFLFGWWMDARGRPERLCLTGMYPLPVGCYYADTLWEITGPSGERTSLSVRSDPFCVREVEDDGE